MYSINAILAIDSYKLGHCSMYPSGITKVYSNFTARSFKHIKDLFPNDKRFFNNKAVVFGISSAFQEIVETFDVTFFKQDKGNVLAYFRDAILPFIGDNSPDVIVNKMGELHDLGYLPIKVKSLPEGVMVNEGIPMLTITNTHDNFAWITNYLETFISSQIWKLSTSATIAKVYKNIFDYYADLTGTSKEFVLFQGHDFSPRGMSGMVDAGRTGSGHLTSFMGTDNICAIEYVKEFYGATGFIGGSVPATEHSVMTMGLEEGELDTFRRLLKTYPKGVVSIVSDSYDYWDTITNKAKILKDEIMSRERDSLGLCKTVFRPDSGDPVKVIVGDDSSTVLAEQKGSVQCLWDIFGGTETHKGYRQLDEHVGLIYGDSITPKRALSILEGLTDKGYASGNIVCGIGSFTYNHLTRDSLGFAMKATYAEIDGKGIQIFKQPKTDSSKNSARGMLRVDLIDGDYVLVDGLDCDDGGELKVILEDGKFKDLPTLQEIRERLSSGV